MKTHGLTDNQRNAHLKHREIHPSGLQKSESQSPECGARGTLGPRWNHRPGKLPLSLSDIKYVHPGGQQAHAQPMSSTAPLGLRQDWGRYAAPRCYVWQPGLGGDLDAHH